MLDVGCGTGRFAAALAERGSRVWGVDPSEEMVALARERGVNAKVARAEALPFKEAWFERAVSVLVIHVLDRPLCVRGARPGAGGRRPARDRHLRPRPVRHPLPQPVLPVARRDRPGEVPDPRGPRRGAPGRRLLAANDPAAPRAVRSREWVLERIRGRFISTLQLLDEVEFAEGLAQAERELPAEVEAEQYLLAVVAERGR